MRSRDFTYSRLTRAAPEPAAVTVRELPASADALLIMRAHFDTRGGRVADPAAALAAVKAAAARFPDDDLAERTLALAEFHWGDKARATSLIDAQMARLPEDAELHRLVL